MSKESREVRRARKAAAKAAARARAARIMAGELPNYLRQPVSVARQPQPPKHKVVRAPAEKPARALHPPGNIPLRGRDREQYADNAPPVWVKDGSYAQDD